MTTKITRINQIAIEKPNEVFTSIYHLINKELYNQELITYQEYLLAEETLLNKLHSLI